MMTKARVAVIWIADRELRIANLSANEIGNSHCQSAIRLRVFYDHALDNIRHVLATIDRGFELLVNFFPLQNSQRVRRIVEKFCNRSVINVVAFVSSR